MNIANVERKKANLKASERNKQKCQFLQTLGVVLGLDLHAVFVIGSVIAVNKTF